MDTFIRDVLRANDIARRVSCKRCLLRRKMDSSSVSGRHKRDHRIVDASKSAAWTDTAGFGEAGTELSAHLGG